MQIPGRVFLYGVAVLASLTGSLGVRAADPPAAAPPDPAAVVALGAKLFAAASDTERDALLAAAPPAIADSPELRRAFHKSYAKISYEGDYARVEGLIRYERRLAERHGDPVSVALSEWGLANLEAQRGQNASALARFQQCRAVFEAAGDKKDVAAVILSAGLIELQTADFRHALEHVRQAHDLFVELADKEHTINALNTLGNIDMDQGMAERAMDYYQQALTLAGGDEDWQVYLFHNIASVLEARGDLAGAASYLERSAALSEKQGLKPVLAENLDVLAGYRLRAGQLDDAEKTYRRALEIADGLGDKRRQTSVLTGLAELGRRHGGEALRPALAMAERAAALARETGEPTRQWQACTTVGKLRVKLGESREARAAFEEVIAVIEEARGHLSGGDEEAMAFFENKFEPYQQAAALLVADGHASQAVGMAERAKSRVLLEILRSPKLDPAQQMTPDERATSTRIAAEITALNRQIAAAKAAEPPLPPEGLEKLRLLLKNARLARDVSESDFFVAHPELRLRQPPRGDALTPEAIRSALGDGRTALLEYVVADDFTLLFVVRAGAATASFEVQAFRLPLRRQALAERTQRFRQTLANRNLGWQTDARELGADLLEPARAAWADADKLIIVPDGPLWELPFQALATDAGVTEPIRPLWAALPVEFAPSLAFLAQARATRRKPSAAKPARLLAFGNPALGKTSAIAGRADAALMDNELAPLPDAERQVRALAELYGADRSRTFVGAAAHEDIFKQMAGDCDVIHFATHGLFNDAAPMYSRLLLSQADLAPDEDGFLEAWEWLPLKLRARLAVLSACETGRGTAGSGEGLIGMSWALFSAGCPAAVVSQWKVDSASTTELMIGFHRRLLAGEEPAAALRGAGLALAKDPRYAHPFYWAPFVLVGAGEAIAPSPPPRR